MQNEFRHIIKEHHAILYKIGRSYTIEEADFKDLYQEILIQLWKSFGKFRGDAKISTWIYRVALNTALTFRRNKNRKPKTDSIEDYNLKIDSEFETNLEQRNEAKIDLLYRCINQLSKDDRAIILLHLEGKKYREIAEIIGLTQNHIGIKLMRIKKQLHHLLTENRYERI